MLEKNKVYLHLLVYFNNTPMPSYVDLAKMIGCSRQTISKKVKELIDLEYVDIDDLGVVHVDNVLHLNVEEMKPFLNPQYNRTIEIDKKEIQKQAIEEMNRNVIIYGIISEGTLKYVGSTFRYLERMREHMLKRPFLKEQNFIILQEVSERERFRKEDALIKMLSPEWNIMSKGE